MGHGLLIRHTAGFACPVCDGWANLPRGRSVRCAGMTGDNVVWCTREELAGNLPIDLETSPPSFRHHRNGWCPCGQEHGHDLPRPRFDALIETLAIEPLPTPSIPDHEIYEQALRLLGLRGDACADLKRRGLSLDAIAQAGYRSVPLDLGERRQFLAQLADQFGEDRLRECPGFVDRNDHLFFWTGASYVVPYVDENRRITGLQSKEIGGKYLTARGARAGQMYHLAGLRQPLTDLFVTEGGLKTEVASRLNGEAVFGVPGQSLGAAHIEMIRRLRPKRVIVALDREANDKTRLARERWIKLLCEAGFNVCAAVWEGADVSGPKGLDDLLLAGGKPRIRQCVVTPSNITARRVARPTDSRGPVTTGLPFEEARLLTQRAIVDFLKGHGPGRARARLVRSSPGTGKTYAVAQALHPAATARILVGTTRLAEELATIFGYGLVRGRSPENCQRFDVADALGKAGHDVARLACGTPGERRCPHRADCAYWKQFEQRGTLVGATEQLFNPPFIRPSSLIVVDDADLPRSLIERHVFSLDTLSRAVAQLAHRKREPVRRLLRILGLAIVGAPDHMLTGPAVWDHLAWVARLNLGSLNALIEALPKEPTLPEPDADANGSVSLEAVDGTPPAALLHLLRALQEELSGFLLNADFNSCLRLDHSGIEVARLREHVADKSGRVYVDEADLLVLDATPVDPLVNHLTARHERLPDVRAEVALPPPPNVEVIQYAERPNGHRALQNDEQLNEVLAQIERERAGHPVTASKEAVIGYRGCRDRFLEAGFAESQVLTFGSARGTNVLAAVDRLHVVGRPMPPASDLAYLAQVIHHDGPPISAQIALVSRQYGGQPYEVDVVDFVDPRASELLRAQRDDELLQDVHRARVACLDPQLRLDGGDAERRAVTLVIHTSHVIPGLRVDDLRLSSLRTTVNEEREANATTRIERAMEELRRRGEAVTVAAVARKTKASWRTVAKHFGKAVHTLQEDSLYRCAEGSQTKSPPPPSPASSSSEAAGIEPRPARPGRVWCHDELVYPDQHCHECAERASDALAARKRPSKRALTAIPSPPRVAVDQRDAATNDHGPGRNVARLWRNWEPAP